MDEKTMVNDVLNNTKKNIRTYEDVITEAENIQLRNAIQQIRNNSESFQYELLRIAESKGYYNIENEASPQEIAKIKKEFEG